MAAIRIQTGQGSPPTTPEAMDVVIEANKVIGSIGDGHWRPLSSISQNALTSEPENPEDDEGKVEMTSPLRNKSRVSIAPEFAESIAESTLRVQGLNGQVPRDPPPTRAASTASHRPNRQRRRIRLRTAPAKLDRAAELHRAFATMDDRTRVTFDGIKGNTRTTVNQFGDRVCRPYSVYTVTKQCERLAISPFGGPLMNSAAGRYRERYLAKHRPDVVQGCSRDSVDVKFKRFYENIDLLAINVKRTPFGTLRKPPPKQARKSEKTTSSVPTQLHKYTNERVANLHESMDRQDSPRGNNVDRKRQGAMSIEYAVAMEVSSNLEKHRKSRPSNLPGLSHVVSGRTDAPRLQSQTESLLTPGELSLKEGISTNLFDQERSRRGPIKTIEKPPRRVKSPPLSKLSREKFLPEAQRRRDQQNTWTGLRIGRPVTPPASEYTALQSSSFATTARPLTAMTSHKSMNENVILNTTSNQQQEDSNGPANQEDEQAGKISERKEPENVTIIQDEKNPTAIQDAEIKEDIEGGNTPRNELSGATAMEEGTKCTTSKESDGKQDIECTQMSDTSPVVTSPDTEGARDVDPPMRNSEGDAEVTSEEVANASKETDNDNNDDALADEEETASADQKETEVNSQHHDNIEQVEN